MAQFGIDLFTGGTGRFLMSVETTGARLLDCAKRILKDNIRNEYLDWNVFLNQRELKVEINRDLDKEQFGYPKLITRFSISWMPECPKVVIFHSVVVDLYDRNQGLGQNYHRIRIDIAKLFGATTAICTINASNKVEKHILEKFGWQFAANVNPPNTELWTKSLV